MDHAIGNESAKDGKGRELEENGGDFFDCLNGFGIAFRNGMVFAVDEIVTDSPMIAVDDGEIEKN